MEVNLAQVNFNGMSIQSDVCKKLATFLKSSWCRLNTVVLGVVRYIQLFIRVFLRQLIADVVNE